MLCHAHVHMGTVHQLVVTVRCIVALSECKAAYVPCSEHGRVCKGFSPFIFVVCISVQLLTVCIRCIHPPLPLFHFTAACWSDSTSRSPSCLPCYHNIPLPAIHCREAAFARLGWPQPAPRLEGEAPALPKQITLLSLHEDYPVVGVYIQILATPNL